MEVRKMRWLPHYYRQVGLYIAIAGLLLVAGIIVLMLLGYQPGIEAEWQKKLFRHLPFLLVLLGLAMRALARDESEDELTRYIRVESMAQGLIGCIAYAFIIPVFEIAGFPIPMDVTMVAILILWAQELAVKQRKKELFGKENDNGHE